MLAIAGTTGTGWVNANVVEPLEYMHDGNMPDDRKDPPP
ncbi:alpha/beta-hydrolase family protein [Streptomyces albidoflavus]